MIRLIYTSTIQLNNSHSDYFACGDTRLIQSFSVNHNPCIRVIFTEAADTADKVRTRSVMNPNTLQ